MMSTRNVAISNCLCFFFSFFFFKEQVILLRNLMKSSRHYGSPKAMPQGGIVGFGELQHYIRLLQGLISTCTHYNLFCSNDQAHK